jgi:hypothetical protein
MNHLQTVEELAALDLNTGDATYGGGAAQCERNKH